MKQPEPAWDERSVWAGEHLGDAALGAIADAQPGVPVEALRHAEDCPSCAARLADAALDAHAAQVALEGVALSERAPTSVRAPSPRLALALGGLVVVASTLATLPAIARGFSTLLFGGRRWIEAAAQVARALLSATSGTGALWVLSAVLLALGIGVAWTANRVGRTGVEHEAG